MDPGINYYMLNSSISKRNLKGKVLHRRYHSCDSGVLSDADIARHMISSTESDGPRREGSWSSLAYSFSDSPTSSGRDYSTGGSSRSTGYVCGSRFPPTPEEPRPLEAYLPELSQVPWVESDVLIALQASKLKQHCGNFSIEFLQRLTYLLQRPLLRIAKEAMRFGQSFNKCSKRSVQMAAKVVLSCSVYHKCNRLASQATALYSMSAKTTNQSKSQQCSLTLSIGKHHRWLIEAHTAGYVHDLAAVYLTGVMESLIEQTVLLAVSKDQLQSTVVTTDMLEAGVQQSVDLYPIYHPACHLLSGRDFTDQPVLPILKYSNQGKMNPSILRSIETSIVSTCVPSISELSDTIGQAMHHWYKHQCDNHTLLWSSSALQTLFYHMRCTHHDCCDTNHPLINVNPERLSESRPPLTEWIKAAATFAEHRKSSVIDDDDVMQAARLLLPYVDCPPRPIRSASSVSADSCVQSIQRRVAVAMLHSCKPQLIAQALTLLKQTDFNYTDDQGLTVLMHTCVSGDNQLVEALLNAGADPDFRVSPSHPTCAGWTALCFAVAHGQTSIAQHLLEHGCSVNGSSPGVEGAADTPLAIASATGNTDCLSLLLVRDADVHQRTLLYLGTDGCDYLTSFKLASSHGHRDLLRRLFGATLQVKTSQLVSLSEMLDEMVSTGDPYTQSLERDNNLRSNLRSNAEQRHIENEYMVIENEYVTLEEVQNADSGLSKLKGCLNSSQLSLLQDSIYNAAEAGFLDICMEIHATGLAWTLYTWFMSLQTAYLTHRKPIIQSLLNEFHSVEYHSNPDLLIDYILPLMLDIFKESKNEMISKQLATIFTHLYGTQPLPALKDFRSHPCSSIDSSHFNSKELADVCFVIERRVFYAHKIILVSASARFKSMLSSLTEPSVPEIEISDIDYQTFELVMQYLYCGCAGLKMSSLDHRAVRNLYSAAHYFQLDGLKRKCEITLSKSLSSDNCVSAYKAAKLYDGVELMEICEAYFLQNLTALLKSCDTFKRALYSSKLHHHDLFNRLLLALNTRLSARLAGYRGNGSQPASKLCLRG